MGIEAEHEGLRALAVVADPTLREELRHQLGRRLQALSFVAAGSDAGAVPPGVNLLLADLDGVSPQTVICWRDHAPTIPRVLVTADPLRFSEPRLASLAPLDVLLRPLTPPQIDLLLLRLRALRALLHENQVMREHLDRLNENQRDRFFPVGITLEEMERRLILRTLASTGGNRAHAARILGVTARTLSNKLKLWRIRGLLSESQR